MENSDINLDYTKFFYFTVIFDDDYKIFEYICEKKKVDGVKSNHLEYHMLKNTEEENIRRAMKISRDKEIIIYGHYNGNTYISNLNGIYINTGILYEKKRLFINDNLLTDDFIIDSNTKTLFLLEIGSIHGRKILTKLLNNLPENIEYIITKSYLFFVNPSNNFPIGLKKIISVDNMGNLKLIKIPWGCKLIEGTYCY
jgi:hypothetical protein